MNKQDAKAVRAAMGKQEGDFIEIHNQWAKVFITQEEGKFIVTGDIADLRASQKEFTVASAAMSYALLSLAEYARGALR